MKKAPKDSIKSTKKSPPDLSIVILNYKSGDYLSKCLKSISLSRLGHHKIEVIVVDNNSPDKSIVLSQKIKTKYPTKYLLLKTNKGFSYGNNQGLKIANDKSKYVLFLNPDTIVKKDTLKKMLDFMDKTPEASAATCKLILVKTNKIQPECHRGFPYPWRSFCYFTGLYKLAPRSAFLNGYFQGNLNLNKIHPVEACVGAFLLVTREAGNKIGWWNEKYFFYGEDLQFCYDLKSNNYNLFYYPHTSIDHYQGISSGLIKHSQKISTASRSTKQLIAKASTNAMRIFYQKNLLQKYSPPLRILVMSGINILEKYRLFKANYL